LCGFGCEAGTLSCLPLNGAWLPLIFFRAPPDIRNIAVALNFYNKIFQLNALNFLYLAKNAAEQLLLLC
jgi:hypothetical protein